LKVSLIFPPSWMLTQPYLSLPALTAFLRKNGVETSQTDLNLLFYEYLLSMDGLTELESMTENRLSDKNIGKMDVRRLKTILLQILVYKRKVDEAKEVLRNWELSRNYGDNLDANRTLGMIMDIYQMYFYGSTLTPTEFHIPKSCSSWESLSEATLDRRINPFLHYFEYMFLPDLLADKPDILGISVVSRRQLISGLTIALLTKRTHPDVHVTIGGPYLSRLKNQLIKCSELFEWVDSIVLYEGEHALLSLAEYVSEGKPLADVPNLIYSEGGEVKHSSAKMTEDADNLPTPDYHGLPLDRYLSPHLILGLQTARGCYWRKCTFCDHSFTYAGRFSRRSAEKVVKDWLFLQESHGARYFEFTDEAILPSHIRDVADNLIASGAKGHWIALARMEKDFDKELMNLLRQSGCILLSYGFESGCDAVLTRMRKGTKTAHSLQVLRNAHQAGIWNHLMTIIGFPGETEPQLEETVEFIIKNREYIDAVNYAVFVLGRESYIRYNPDEFNVQILWDESEEFSLNLEYRIDNRDSYHFHHQNTYITESRHLNKILGNFERSILISLLGENGNKELSREIDIRNAKVAKEGMRQATANF